MSSGIRQRTCWCTACGTLLWSEGRGEYVTFRPGTLDDTSWLTPVAHIWTKSAQTWVKIPEGVLSYEKGLGGDYFDVARAALVTYLWVVDPTNFLSHP